MQSLYIMLIKLKAATMSRQCGNAELNWRFETWRKQQVKVQARLLQTYNYESFFDEDVGNINENEYDQG